MSLVDFRQVSFSYDKESPVFRDVSFSLAAGSFHYLTGPSGTGKSSLIRLLYGAQSSYGGQIFVLGQDLRRLNEDAIAELRRNIGVVFQDFLLLDHLSVLDNVAIPLRISGQSWSKARKIAQTILDWIGLAEQMNASPQTLSGGQKQRAVIARAVINRPKIILADEPTGNLDHENALKLLYLFEELNKQGTTILLATHNQDLLTSFPHERFHLEKGLLTPCPPETSHNPSLKAVMNE